MQWVQLEKSDAVSICTKTFMSLTFKRAKQCILGQPFLNQDTSNELNFTMYSNYETHDSYGIEIWQACGRFNANTERSSRLDLP